MKLFGIYIRQHQKGIFTFLLFSAVFLGSFLLYHLPPEAVLYPAFLCALTGGLFLLRDFSQVRRRHQQLCRLQGTPSAEIRSLPKPRGVEDADYQALIQRMQEESAESRDAAAARYREMMEYYTIWVHQIKTPITSMRLALEPEDTPLSRKLSADLRQIEQYVEMVLAYLRLDSDSSDYVFKEYDLDEIVKQSVAGFASEFIARRIRLDYTPLGRRVVTDDKWLTFVLEQVLSNALKYTREGSVKIWLEEPLTLCIADTGIGIAPEDLPRVFEKGYTGYNGRKDRRASGIGLYLCKRICGSLGADITLSSVPDGGTTVRIRFGQYQLHGE